MNFSTGIYGLKVLDETVCKIGSCIIIFIVIESNIHSWPWPIRAIFKRKMKEDTYITVR
jgi:hypothetical protein